MSKIHIVGIIVSILVFVVSLIVLITDSSKEVIKYSTENYDTTTPIAPNLATEVTAGLYNDTSSYFDATKETVFNVTKYSQAKAGASPIKGNVKSFTYQTPWRMKDKEFTSGTTMNYKIEG